MDDTASSSAVAPDSSSEIAAASILPSADSERDVSCATGRSQLTETVESEIVVTFEKEGPLGLVLRDDMLVADTAPGSASRLLGVQPGCFLTHVGDNEVSSIGGLQDVLAALRASPRPLNIKLRRPKVEAAVPVAEAAALPPSLAAKEAASSEVSTERSTVKIAQSARTAVASAGSALKSFLSSGAQAIAAVDRAIDRAIDQSAKSVASAARATVSSSKRAAARVRTRAGEYPITALASAELLSRPRACLPACAHHTSLITKMASSPPLCFPCSIWRPRGRCIEPGCASTRAGCAAGAGHRPRQGARSVRLRLPQAHG